LVLRAFGVTDKGPIRPGNEDCFAVHEDLGLLVIADGMGGHNAGEVAAQIVVEAVVDHVRRVSLTMADGTPESESSLNPYGHDESMSEDGNILRNAILLANARILETSSTTDQYAGMGTTVVAARVDEGRVTVCHVGDSRLYLMAGDKLRQLTDDDSWVATMLANAPDANPQRFQHHPMRHALTNVVGGRSQTEVHVVEEKLNAGDMLLLTTDGVHGVLENELLAELMASPGSLSSIARRIVRTAMTRGTHDNCTAIVARYQA
jgi:serine/threonine protein phosphatase PrpC